MAPMTKAKAINPPTAPRTATRGLLFSELAGNGGVTGTEDDGGGEKATEDEGI